MRTSEEEDIEHKTGFIMLLFGYETRMKKDDFIEELKQPKANWIFDSEQVRHRL